MKKTMQLIFSLAFTAIFTLVATAVFASPLPDKPHIYVEGSAEIEVAPDQMTIIVGLSHIDPDIALAKQAVDERSTLLINACKEIGIGSEDLATTALHVSPAYEYRSGERVPVGTRVYRQVDITLKNLEKYPQLMAALIDADISNTVSTSLEVSNEKALSDQALVAAIEDARQRAAGMVASLDKKLGKVHSVSEFDTRRDERNQLFTQRGVEGQAAQAGAKMELRSAASEPFEPGLLIASAWVYVVFFIK